jgi:hypothetical protein
MRITLCFMAALAGCGVDNALPPGAADPGASEQDSIQGGSKDAKDPAVGLVWIRGGGFCTGTLIAPNVVLTAGHCVADPVSAFYTGEGVGTSTVGRQPAAGFVAHKVIDQIAHPDYQDANECPNPTHDVALLRLENPAAGTTPLAIARRPPRAGASCRAVGYGVHSARGGRETIEQKRSGTEKVLAVDDSSVAVKKGTGIVDHGDSGGPLLCGKLIAGTTSCGNDPSPAHTDAYYGRVDNVADWIDATVAGWQ